MLRFASQKSFMQRICSAEGNSSLDKIQDNAIDQQSSPRDNVKLRKNSHRTMVLLTMTPAMVRAVEYARQVERSRGEDERAAHSPLHELPPGAPITHEEVLGLAKEIKQLKQAYTANNLDTPSHALDQLLRGSRVYVEPPKPRPEPV